MANKSSAKKDTAKKTDADAAPTKRSGKRLALVAAVALAALAGGGYGAWAYLLKPAAPAAEAERAPDPVKVAAIAPEVAAETSFTHSYALSVLIRPACGGYDVPALKEASDKEARADGWLVTLSWQAAARRTSALAGRSCEYMLAEISAAEYEAEQKAKAPAPAAEH